MTCQCAKVTEFVTACVQCKKVLEFSRVDKNHRIETAPINERILVYCVGGWRFGIKDDLGNWRARHNGPIKGTPSYWRPVPPAPN